MCAEQLVQLLCYIIPPSLNPNVLEVSVCHQHLFQCKRPARMCICAKFNLCQKKNKQLYISLWFKLFFIYVHFLILHNNQIYVRCVFGFMMPNYRFIIPIKSHESSGISFRIIALSTQMTDSLGKSLCGSLLKHKVPKQDAKIYWLGLFDDNSSVLSVKRHSSDLAYPITNRRQTKELKLFHQVAVHHFQEWTQSPFQCVWNTKWVCSLEKT